MRIGFEYVIGLFVFVFSFLVLQAAINPFGITGFAATPKSEQTTADLSINRYINTGIDKVPVNFTFTGIVPGYWYNASNNASGKYGWPSEMIIFPETNTAVNVSYWGSQYFCRTSGSGLGCNVTFQNRFDVGNLTYNTTSKNFTVWPGDSFYHYATGEADVHIVLGNNTPAGSGSQIEIYDCTCPCGEHNYTLPIFYRLLVPAGVYAGNWEANITFKVMDTGGGA